MPNATPPNPPTDETNIPAAEQVPATVVAEAGEAQAEVAAAEKKVSGPERTEALIKEVETLKGKTSELEKWMENNPLTRGEVVMDDEAKTSLEDLKAKMRAVVTRLNAVMKILKPETAVEKTVEFKADQAVKKTEAEALNTEQKREQLLKSQAELMAYGKALTDYQNALVAWEGAKTTTPEFDAYKAQMEEIVEKLFDHYSKVESLTEHDLKSLEQAIRRNADEVSKELEDLPQAA